MPIAPAGQLDLVNPIADHPLNKGLVGWWQPLAAHLNPHLRMLNLIKGGAPTVHVNTNGGQSGMWTGEYAQAYLHTNVDYISSTLPKALGGSGADKWTIAARYARQDLPTYPFRGLGVGAIRMSYYTHSSANQRVGYINESLAWRDGGITFGGGMVYHDMTITCNALNIRMFYDGALILTQTEPSWGIAASQDVNFAYTENGPYGVGFLAWARIYDRVLSDQEVAWLHDQSKNGKPDLIRKRRSKVYDIPTAAGSATDSPAIMLSYL